MTTPTNSDRLREIAERAEKATPGPWEVESEVFPSVESADGRMKIYDEGGHDYDDANFIAAAREDVPFLLAEIAKLKAEKAETIEVLEKGTAISGWDVEALASWWIDDLEPLLDKLKGES